MNPYLAALVAAGIITQDDAERINRSLDPTAARAWAEQQIAVAMQGGLSSQQQRLVDLLRARNGNVSQTELDAFWRAEDERLWQALRVNVEEVASETAIGAATRLGGTWNYINERVIGWTNAYYTSADPAFVGSVPNLNQTTRQQVADAFVRWNRGELNDGRRGGLPALIVELQGLPQFNPNRAALVAATEVTRIFAEAENAAAEADADLEYMTWQAANDELMCAICAPLNGRSVRKGQEFVAGVRLPPAHPNCRCTVTATTGPAEEATRGTLKPVAPRQTGAAARPAATRVPVGTPVSKALDMTLSGSMAKSVTRSMDAIDKVHGDGDLSIVPVKKSTSAKAAGMYEFVGNKAVSIKMSVNGEAPEMTFAHEAGHWLDHQQLGISIRTRKIRDMLVQNSEMQQAIDEYWQVVTDTKPVKTLKEWEKKGHTVKGTRQVWKDGAIVGEEVDVPVSKKYIRYLLDNDEIWARSYAQYVTERSGDAVMQQQLKNYVENNTYPAQWESDDFKPVIAAIDKIMSVMGWIK